MSSSIYVNANIPIQTRVAVVEDNGEISRFFVQNGSTLNLSIFKAKVGKWQPNLQAYFVDFGLSKAGFLPRSNSVLQKAPNEGGLKEGDWILVQILDENPGWNKGAKLTEQISLVSKFAALKVDSQNSVNFPEYVQPDFKEDILKLIAAKSPENAPVHRVNFKSLFQTRHADAVVTEYLDLLATYQSIEKYAESLNAPGIVYTGNNIIDRILELRKSNTQHIYTDNDIVHQSLNVRLLLESPVNNNLLKQHQSPVPLFEQFNINSNLGIETENREVHLPSGGSISFDKTEALTSIDINSGKGSSSEKTATSMVVRVNLEAAEAVVRELKKREIGGLIVIDFIDMSSESDRDQIDSLMKNLLSDEKKTLVLPISEIGLMQIARPKFNTNDSHESVICEHCNGNGVGISPMQGCITIIRMIEKYYFKQMSNRTNENSIDAIFAAMPEFFADQLLNDFRSICSSFEEYYGTKLVIISDSTRRHINDVELNINKRPGKTEPYQLKYLDKETLPFDLTAHLKGAYDSKRSFQHSAERTQTILEKKKRKNDAKHTKNKGSIWDSFMSLFNSSPSESSKKTNQKLKGGKQSGKKNNESNSKRQQNKPSSRNLQAESSKNSSSRGAKPSAAKRIRSKTSANTTANRTKPQTLDKSATVASKAKANSEKHLIKAEGISASDQTIQTTNVKNTDKRIDKQTDKKASAEPRKSSEKPQRIQPKPSAPKPPVKIKTVTPGLTKLPIEKNLLEKTKAEKLKTEKINGATSVAKTSRVRTVQLKTVVLKSAAAKESDLQKKIETKKPEQPEKITEN